MSDGKVIPKDTFNVLAFYDDAGEQCIGTLDIIEGRLVFKGNADVCAKQFFYYLIEHLQAFYTEAVNQEIERRAKGDPPMSEKHEELLQRIAISLEAIEKILCLIANPPKDEGICIKCGDKARFMYMEEEYCGDCMCIERAHDRKGGRR